MAALLIRRSEYTEIRMESPDDECGTFGAQPVAHRRLSFHVVDLDRRWTHVSGRVIACRAKRRYS